MYTSSFTCWSVGITFLWIGGDKTIWIGFVRIGLVILALGGLLFLFGTMLFILRGILLDQAFRKRGIRLRFRDAFRRTEGARLYQREIWLQGTVLLILPLFVLLWLFAHRIIQNSLIPTPNLLALRDQEYLDLCTTMTICLVFPLGMLLYALASKDVTDALSKDGSEEVLGK